MWLKRLITCFCAFLKTLGQAFEGLTENSTEFLKSSAACFYYNTALAVTISHGSNLHVCQNWIRKVGFCLAHVWLLLTFGYYCQFLTIDWRRCWMCVVVFPHFTMVSKKITHSHMTLPTGEQEQGTLISRKNVVDFPGILGSQLIIMFFPCANRWRN